MAEPHQLHDVAIVGCGPVGALLADRLSQAGLSVVVIERDHVIFRPHRIGPREVSTERPPVGRAKA